MTGRPFVVVVTGSECTGKTTLARELAAAFDAPCSPEFVRAYLDGKGAELDASDVEPIARGQMRVEDAATSAATGLVVKDTDLVSTVVYARHYYGACPDWIAQAAADRRADLYLLLHPDVPWVEDGLQRDRPAERDHLHGLFRAALAALGAAVADVTGPWDERRSRALAAIAASRGTGRVLDSVDGVGGQRS
jgi:NadR type nicotinamide-nucleotide adenylyltransferase